MNKFLLTFFFFKEPNAGISLWVQQFWAMFIKRFYYTIRFYPSLVIQIVFPVIFTLVGILVILTSKQGDDRPRFLFMNNSALDSSHLIAFHAELDGRYLNFSVR